MQVFEQYLYKMKLHLISLIMIISGNLYSQRIELFKQKGSEVTIIDTVENYKIVIDSSHLFVSVFNPQNDFL
jgi:hypothetical protein